MRHFKKYFMLTFTFILMTVLLFGCRIEGPESTIKISVEKELVAGRSYSYEIEVGKKAGTTYQLSLSKEGIVSIDEETHKIKALAEGKVVLTAKSDKDVKSSVWLKVSPALEYTIEYHLNGGEASDLVTSYNTLNEGITLGVPTKEGYNFAGWYTNAEYNGEVVTEIKAGEEGDKVFYAKWEKIIVNYKVTFDACGGKEVSEILFTELTEEFALPTTTKEGYNFLGWYENEERIEKVAQGTERNISVVAKWEAIKYTITYELNGGVLEGAVSEYTIEDEVVLVAPTKANYTFVGWYKGTEKVEKLEVGTTGDVTLTAKWEAEKYTITYELNGGVLEGAVSEYTVEDEVVLAVPTKAKYTFVGWYETADFSGEAITKIEAGTVGAKTFYAKWELAEVKLATPVISAELVGETLKVTFTAVENATGYTLYVYDGTEEVLKVENYVSGAEVTFNYNGTYQVKVQAIGNGKEVLDSDLSAAASITYTVKGIVVSEDRTGNYKTIKAAFDAAVDGDVINIKAGTYALDFVINKSVTFKGVDKDQVIIKVAAGVLGNVAASDITFDSVTLTGDGANKAGRYFQASAATQNFTVKNSNINEFNTFVIFQVATTNKIVVTLENNKIERVGQFLFWVTAGMEKINFIGNTVESCGTIANTAAALFRVRSGSVYVYGNTFTGDVTAIAALFEAGVSGETFEVKYNTFKNVTKFVRDNGGNPVVFDKNVYLNADGTLLTEVPSTITGAGVSAGEAVSEEERAAAYDDFMSVKYSITYNLNGGVNPENAPKEFREGSELTLPTPTKENAFFAGWFTNPEFTGEALTVIPKDTKTDLVLYAKFVDYVYSAIIVDLDGGECPDMPATYVEGLGVVLPVPTKDGYIFLGWSLEKDGTEYITSISETQTGEVTLFANWKEKSTAPTEHRVGEGETYKTIAEALEMAVDGDIIIIGKGEFTLEGIITKSVTFKGAGYNDTIIKCAKDVAGNLNADTVIFDGVTLQGVGGGAGIPGVYFQVGAKAHNFIIMNSRITAMNTFIKFQNNACSDIKVLFDNDVVDNIGQFLCWVTEGMSEIRFESSTLDASTCGGIVNKSAALFRVRSGSAYIYNSTFIGDTQSIDGLFECGKKAGKVEVKYNTFKYVTKYVHINDGKPVEFDHNLYLNEKGEALTTVPSEITGAGVVPGNVVLSEKERLLAYVASSDTKFVVNYDVDGGVLPENAQIIFDVETGIDELPTPTKGNLKFMGWYNSEGQLVTSIPAGTKENVTLTAKWAEEGLYVGSGDEYEYQTISEALAAAKAGDKIFLAAGEYTENITIALANISIIGPNKGISASSGRVPEAIIKGVITVAQGANYTKLEGLSFTGDARITAGSTAGYEGFTFINNKVYDTSYKDDVWVFGRYGKDAFITFKTSSTATKSVNKNFQFVDNSFENVPSINVLVNRVHNISFAHNTFKNFKNDAVRIEGGYCYGTLSFTYNTFEQTTAESANHGIFFYSVAGPSGSTTNIIIRNNSFIKLGKDNGVNANYSGAISAHAFQENPLTWTIEDNVFDHCYNYLYLRNNGAKTSTWACLIQHNAFLGLPTTHYFGSYNGSDKETTNPHLAVFGENYYEDNDGKVISDLTEYASLFKHLSTYGTTLSEKPTPGTATDVRFYTISYDLDGGTVKSGSLVTTYTSLITEPIPLPTPTKTNHNFLGWDLNGTLVTEIPADVRGDILLTAKWQIFEGELYNITFNTIRGEWPTRDALDREEIVEVLFNDLYKWAKTNGYTDTYEKYVETIKTKIAAYEDINLRNTKLKNNPTEDGDTTYFFNIPEYYEKWHEFFELFNTAMLAVNSTQSFYTDTYAAMVRVNQFITWSATGKSYFQSYLPKMLKAVRVLQEIPTSYRGGQVLVLPVLTSKIGLDFLGWYDNPDFNGDPITEISSTDTGDKIFYAKWEDEIVPTKININAITELKRYETHQLVWSFEPADATNKEVEFFSSDETIATVSPSKGLITAHKNGKVTITMKVYGNRNLDVVMEITVYSPAHIVGEYATNSFVVVDQTIELAAAIIGDDAASIVWESLNPEIASVNNGIVTGLSKGLAVIVAKSSNDDSVRLEFTVNVLEAELEGILKFLAEQNNANIYTEYGLLIGGTYKSDIYGSVNKVLGEDLVINDEFYAIQQAKDADGNFKNTNFGGEQTSTEFITVHYTGNMAAGATARANANYFSTGGGGTSIHYVTGNDGVYSSLDEKYVGFHAGDSTNVTFTWNKTGVKHNANDPQWPVWGISSDSYFTINGQKTLIKTPYDEPYTNRLGQTYPGNGQVTDSKWINDMGLSFKIVDGEYYMGTTWWCHTQVFEGRICSKGGNNNSIGIESAVNEGSDLWYTWQKTAQLVANIMVRKDLDITRVVGHHFFSAKNCPQPMLENNLEIWHEFIELVEAEYEMITTYKDYDISIKSNNPDIVDNRGRVISVPEYATCVTYTITATKGEETYSITLSSIIPGIYQK